MMNTWKRYFDLGHARIYSNTSWGSILIQRRSRIYQNVVTFAIVRKES